MVDIWQEILIKDEIVQIVDEARNHAALDTGCANSMVGKLWLEVYLQEAGKEGKGEMIGPLSSNQVFKVGKGGMLRSTGRYLLPINVAGKHETGHNKCKHTATNVKENNERDKNENRNKRKISKLCRICLWG